MPAVDPPAVHEHCVQLVPQAAYWAVLSRLRIIAAATRGPRYGHRGHRSQKSPHAYQRAEI
jgi:hypothetical protein